MLFIKINNQALDLSNDFSISLVFKSALFNDLGDYSFPFTVPSTLRNRGILGWKNRLASVNDIYEQYDGSLGWNSYLLFSGQVIIREANNDFFEGTIFFGKGNFNYEIKNLILNQIDYGSRQFSSEDAAMTFLNWTLDKYYPEVEFSMPYIRNVDFFNPPATNPELWAYNLIFPNGLLHKLTTNEQNRTILIPFVYLRFVLNTLAEKTGYALTDKFFVSRNELSRLVIYNSNNINEGSIPLNKVYYSTLLPNVKVSEFISGLENWVNCCFMVDFTQRTIKIVSKKDILFKSKVIEFSDNILSVSHEIPDKENATKLTMQSDYSDKVYQDQLDYEEDTVNHIKGAYQTLSDVPYAPFRQLGDIFYIITLDAWYQWGEVGNIYDWILLPYGPVLTDRFYYKLGSNVNEINTAFSSLMDINGEVSCGNLGTDKNDITPRLFWVNRFTIEGTPTNLHGSAYSNSFSLRYPGANGVFNLYWKPWIDWIMNDRKSIKVVKQMDFIELKELDFTKRYRFNGINCLISEVQVTLTSDQIKPATLKCFTCY